MKDTLILKNAVVTLALVTSPALAADPAPEEASAAPVAEAAPEADAEPKAEARAAVTLGAGPEAEARVLTTAEETEPAPAVEASDATSDRTGPKNIPYMKRYVPEPLMWELGLYGGLMFPANDHQLYAPSLPLADQRPFKLAGEVGARVAFFPLTFLGVEAEAALMPTAVEDGTEATLWTVRGHAILQIPGSSITPFALVGGGVLGASSNEMGNDDDDAFHFGAGVKAALDEHLSLRLDVRDVVSRKYDAGSGSGAHSPEILLGITFVPTRKRPDLDGDGFLDYQDECPTVAGTDRGCIPIPPDTDGDGVADDVDECVDAPGIAPTGCPDSDGDGIIDLRDPCPEEAGPAPSGCPEKICPIQDTDGDGLIDSVDECPNEPARTITGCVVHDQDGDGIPDSVDKCPTQPETKNGLDDEDGCPDVIPEKVTKFVGVIKGIEFDFGSAKIKKASEPLLREAAAVLKSYPDLRVRITGHTDDQGEREQNLKISTERAQSVKDFLVAQGVSESQLSIYGAGPDLPIADNATAAGRQRNRRIEFSILQD
ncbi:MAG: hypothetical protein B6A08_09705 [Sorangiineae bacterium NIC37A_2]|jgi:outer membrane protein OmpA-like peptidoglycan-associated protein|nr:MAG: hypothetical protein B6A08_09705 [Sorangiineae bacterium NIC37A_2]